MARIIYRDFNLQVGPLGDPGNYLARVKAGGGDARAKFSISEIELEASPVGDERPGQRVVKDFGASLFRAVFKDEVYGCLRSSLAEARLRRARLRIRLNLTDAPELATLPWEHLYNPTNGNFYALSAETPIVRCLDQAEPIERRTIKLPLRILVMVSGPVDCDQLDTEREWQSLDAAFNPLKTLGLVELERLSGASVTALQETLWRRKTDRPFHIFHFIGHGEFDEKLNEGVLVLEDAHRQGSRVSGETLGTIFREHRTLRLAVLNACSGASVSLTDSYVGAAQSLLRPGLIPAVVAMQSKISDPAAIIFATRFYAAVADGDPIDAALSEARLAMYAHSKETKLNGSKCNEAEWGTPVLYMRSVDGRIFDIKKAGDPAELTEVHSFQPDAPTNGLSAHYQSVIDSLLDGKLVPFLGLDINMYGRKPIEWWEPGPILPGYDELAGYLARTYKYPSIDIPGLICVSQYVAFMKGAGMLDDKLSEVFKPGFAPSALHQFIAGLAAEVHGKKRLRARDASLRRFLTVTTNYDDLTECAFKKCVPAMHLISYLARGEHRGRFIHSRFRRELSLGQPEPILVPNDYHGLVDEDPVVLNLHGAVDTITFDQRFAITEDHSIDYLSRKDLSSSLPSELKKKLKRSSFLLLGFDIRQWNLRALLYGTWEAAKPNYETWAVRPNPSDCERKFFKECGIELIEMPLEEYVSGLNRCVSQL